MVLREVQYVWPAKAGKGIFEHVSPSWETRSMKYCHITCVHGLIFGTMLDHTTIILLFYLFIYFYSLLRCHCFNKTHRNSKTQEKV